MIRLKPINVDLTIAEMEAVLYRNLYSNIVLALEWEDLNRNNWDQQESLEILKRMNEADGPIIEKDVSIQRNENDYYYYNIHKKMFVYNRHKKNVNVLKKGIKTLIIVVSLNELNDDFPINYAFYRPKEKNPFYDFDVSWSEFKEVDAIRE